jgi:hypothetical protein
VRVIDETKIAPESGEPEVIRLRKLVLRFYERLAGDSRRDQGSAQPQTQRVHLPADTRTMSSAAVSAMATPRVPEVRAVPARSHAGYIVCP